MTRAIIVEDELASQELLTNLVHEYCPGLEIIGVAGNVADAVQMIQSSDIDLLFLDIHIGQQTGFDVLDQIKDRDFKVIFTTAHEEYALKAFKYEAVDYLLKPYTPRELIASVNRIREKIEENKAFLKLERAIKQSLQQKDADKITIPTSDGLKVFKLENMLRLEANGAYCKIIVADARPMLVSKSLKEVEQMLPLSQFFRTHDSHIINLRHVRAYKKEDGGSVILENNDEIPVSRRRKQEFLEVLMAR